MTDRKLSGRFAAIQLAFALCGLAASGCAGPSTPLGALWNLTPPSWRGRLLLLTSDAGNGHRPEIRFYPRHQVLHGAHTLTIEIEDPAGVLPLNPPLGDPQPFVIKYNGVEVTPSFLMQAKLETLADGRTLVMKIPNLRFAPGRDHHIEATYRARSGVGVSVAYRAPECDVHISHAIQNTDAFNPNPALLAAVDKLAREAGYNPAFVAALIAQESGFNAKRVSWAKALGLTQITPVAEAQLRPHPVDWPVFSNLDALPAWVIEAMVMSGEVNRENDWRLDPERSIRGGLRYLGDLESHWQRRSLASERGPAPEGISSERAWLALASYHSGFTRVAIATRETEQLTSPGLRAAREYVDRIRSYCEHFAEPPRDPHENST